MHLTNSSGFSLSNLKYMAQFYEAYKDFEFSQLPVGQISWRCNILLLQKVKTTEIRLWFAEQVLKEGWSRTVLLNQIGLIDEKRINISKTYNYDKLLPTLSKDQINEFYQEPIVLPFELSESINTERKIEKMMVNNMIKILLQFGKGFSYLGEQYPLRLNNKEYFIDLLFYNVELRRYFVIELKPKEFDPRDLGQLSFYMSAVNKTLKRNDEDDTIGILLCKEKDRLVAEIALENTNQPVGIVEYIYKNEVPKYLADYLPTMAEIEFKMNTPKKEE